MVENVQVDQKLLFEKQNDVSQIENKIKLLHQSAQKNKNTILSKTEDMNFLKHQLNKLQESVKLFKKFIIYIIYIIFYS